MKNLKTYLKECEGCNISVSPGNFTTPMNTTGMGNPSGPDDNGIASEPLPTNCKKCKKRKHIKIKRRRF